MSAKIIDGKAIADKILLDLKAKIAKLYSPPGLAAILIGNDEASKIYVKNKKAACEKIGMNFHLYSGGGDFYQNAEEKDILEMIDFLNCDQQTHGIIVQLPMPQKFNVQKIIGRISPQKDVDGFLSKTKVTPPTIAAIIELLKATGEDLKDKKTLIIGKSDIFIRGIEKHLDKQLNIKKIETQKSIPTDSVDYDLIVIALGRAKALKKSVVKKGAIVIDIGINKIKGKIMGDVDPKVASVASWLSPVPGGVGPLTVACLLKNVYSLAKNAKGKE